MAELSRIKKFEDLRESIQNDREGEIHSEALSPFAQRLSRIDNTFKPAREQASSAPHQSQHGKRDVRFDTQPYEPTGVSTFRNEFLDDFLEEVKNYNIKKGYRGYEDTQSNIITGAVKESKTKEFSKDGQSVVASLQKESRKIEYNNDSQPVYFAPPKPLVIEEPEDLSDDEINLTNEIKQVIFANEKEEPLSVLGMPNIAPVPSTDNFKEVLEETQKLRVQLDEYEKELNGMTMNVSKSNRLLNLIVIVLVLVLIMMLGMAVFWVLTSRGLI